MQPGDVVYSKAGRDRGRYFVVVEVCAEEGFVRVADGDIRRIKKKKKKNQKHLRPTGDRLERIAAKLAEGAQVFDSELFSALRLYGDKDRENK